MWWEDGDGDGKSNDDGKQEGEIVIRRKFCQVIN